MSIDGVMFRSSRCSVLFLGLIICALSACVNTARAPIAQKTVGDERAQVHSRGEAATRKRTPVVPVEYVVQRGDTLHSIAWRFGLDYREIAQWNQLRNPDRIYVGQRLHLRRRATPPAVRAQAPTPTARPQPTPSRGAAPGPVTVPRKPAPVPASPAPAGPVAWQWPAAGAARPAQSALGARALEILGERGDPVRAAAAGTIVYSGSGLRGYGRLIIVKHNEEYLSAYAHNERLLVDEGARVKSGETIAEMGDSDAKRVMLHFEIRRDGKAVEPLKLLPRR